VQSFKAVKRAGNLIVLTVRGLFRREVKRLRHLPIRFSVNADDLLALKSAMERDQSLVMTFLHDSGINSKTSPLAFPPYLDRLEERTTGNKPSSAGTKASSQSWFEARGRCGKESDPAGGGSARQGRGIDRK